MIARAGSFFACSGIFISADDRPRSTQENSIRSIWRGTFTAKFRARDFSPSAPPK